MNQSFMEWLSLLAFANGFVIPLGIQLGNGGMLQNDCGATRRKIWRNWHKSDPLHIQDKNAGTHQKLNAIMNNTPETNAAGKFWPCEQLELVDADFARRLERERDEAREQTLRGKIDISKWEVWK